MTRDLVLLHGWAMNRRVWEPVLPVLSGSCRVHNLGLPGYPGGCGEAAAAEVETGQSLLDRWSDQCLAAAPSGAVWLGWSLGAMVVMNALLRAPDMIEAAVLTAPTPRFVAGEDWDAGIAPDVMREFLRGMRIADRRVLRRFVTLQSGNGDAGRGTARALNECLVGAAAGASVLAAGLKVLEEVDLRPHLHRLHSPVLVIHGTKDCVVPPAAGAWIADRAARGELVSMATGHAPFVASPQEFASRVLSWI